MTTRFSQTPMSYFLVFLLLLMLRVIDLYITYLITPDLTSEWNPLISHFNLSWQAFVLVQSLLLLMALWGYHRFVQRNRDLVDQPGLSLIRFVYYYFNGHDFTWGRWTRSFIRIPGRHYYKSNAAFIGFVIVAGFVFSSVFAILHNVLVLYEISFYLNFVLRHATIYLPAVFTVLVIISANIFFMYEYARYKRVVGSTRIPS